MKDFKASQGKWLLKSLFWELCDPEKRNEFARYTIKDEPHEGYPSLRQLYIAMQDVTEYEFATTYLGGYAHWKNLCACAWFKPIVEEWREELEVKLRSQAIREIKAHSTSEKGFQAAKWLAEKGWEEKKVGGKSKAEQKKEERVTERIHSSIEEDITRLRSIN